jgi:hypothetical protein
MIKPPMLFTILGGVKFLFLWLNCSNMHTRSLTAHSCIRRDGPSLSRGASTTYYSGLKCRYMRTGSSIDPIVYQLKQLSSSPHPPRNSFIPAISLWSVWSDVQMQVLTTQSCNSRSVCLAFQTGCMGCFLDYLPS